VGEPLGGAALRAHEGHRGRMAARQVPQFLVPDELAHPPGLRKGFIRTRYQFSARKTVSHTVQQIQYHFLKIGGVRNDFMKLGLASVSWELLQSAHEVLPVLHDTSMGLVVAVVIAGSQQQKQYHW